ncbi:SDR family NAD(P)-dependent oxidoreductase [Actinomadura parmotrematis]|uniref:SDR family NAD(P)-dependent oxidoreductase n=1 Tax=Actinomadura parmotrematis TaxID=2864039 RepID=A0ABS7FQP0_9ACTN|nr:SDR family NAD(P)-dependent oxidoreductase [Actinomadura parmotrematis]MBW8482720.1 SDR family NAD(P)-dependent oxidoreductase [Actinomadura parmotrematis]
MNDTPMDDTPVDGTPAGDARPLAVVTGASSGIGRELAGEFARHGFDVVMAAEDAGIVEAAAAVAAETGVTALPVRVDLAAFDGVEELHGRVQALARTPAALAVNAGIGVNGDFARETGLDDELRLVNLNVTSAVHLAKRVLPAMVAANEGRVLFTSSVAATGPGPYQATYAASKAFLLSFSEALRHELRDTGVTVTALMPGATDTEFFDRAGMQDTKLGRSGGKDDPAKVAEQGFKALMAGKDHVVAGSFKNKLQAAAAKVAPEKAKAKLQGKLTEPGSGDR